MAGVQIDGVNNKIDFDDDLDTSISANTDDTLVIEAGGVNIASITAGEFAINEGSADIDFRVESNGNANMLFVDGGNDRVAIGTTNVSSGAPLIISSGFAKTDTTSRSVFSIQTSDASAQGQLKVMNIGGASAADRKWQFQTSENGVANAGQLEFQVDGGSVQMGTTGGGHFFLNSANTVFNEGSTDTDFRVESNGNTHMLFVDGGNNHVNIGQAADSEHTLNVAGNGFFTTADNTDTLTLECTDADANSGPVLCLHRNSGSPADGDLIGRIDFSGESDLGSEQNYAVIKTFADDVSHGTENGQFSLFTRVAGSEIDRMTCGSAATVFNDGSADLDFRVETNGAAHALFVDGGNDVVMFGGTGSGSGTTTARSVMYSSGHIYQFVATNSTTDIQRFYNADTGNEIGSIEGASSSTAFRTTSDYRLKENVDYDWDATTRLKQLKPARFNWIVDDTNTPVDGFLAHEVSSVVPEAVGGEKDAVDDDDKIIPQGIDQSKLVPLMVKTIQELEARIEALEG